MSDLRPVELRRRTLAEQVRYWSAKVLNETEPRLRVAGRPDAELLGIGAALGTIADQLEEPTGHERYSEDDCPCFAEGERGTIQQLEEGLSYFEQTIASLRDRVRELRVERDDETDRLRALLGEAGEYLLDVQDEGPAGEGWKSDGLKTLLARIAEHGRT